MGKEGVVLGTCQSCGMRMHKLGSEEDGAPNKDYCLRCYRDGEFTLTDTTIEQMVRISAQTPTSSRRRPSSRWRGSCRP